MRALNGAVTSPWGMTVVGAMFTLGGVLMVRDGDPFGLGGLFFGVVVLLFGVAGLAANRRRAATVPPADAIVTLRPSRGIILAMVLGSALFAVSGAGLLLAGLAGESARRLPAEVVAAVGGLGVLGGLAGVLFGTLALITGSDRLRSTTVLTPSGIASRAVAGGTIGWGEVAAVEVKAGAVPRVTLHLTPPGARHRGRSSIELMVPAPVAPAALREMFETRLRVFRERPLR